MEPTVLITDAPSTGYAYLVRLPYRHMPFVTAFKEQIPESGRDWHARLLAWLFRRAHLDAVRQLVAQFAEAEGWRVLDTTVISKEQATQLLQELEQQEHEAHVAAVLDVLPKLPDNALTLAGWLPEVLVMDLEEYLGEELFATFIAAGYPDRKYASVPYISKRSSKTARITIANDARIVRALLGKKIYQKIQHLSLKTGLSPVATFDDGIMHWQDEAGAIWFGAPYMQALEKQEHIRDLTRPKELYRVVAHEDQIHLVGEALAYIQQFSTWSDGPYISSTPPDHKSIYEIKLSTSIHHWHLERWFIDWAHQAIAQETCNPHSEPYHHRWYWENASYWIHPAQALVYMLLSYHEEEAQDMLGWDDAYLQAQYKRIKQLKAQHAQNYLHYCREHATELAMPELRSKKGKGELLQLGEQYDIALRKSWTNDHMIEVLTGSGQQSVKLAHDLLEIPEQQIDEWQAIRS